MGLVDYLSGAVEKTKVAITKNKAGAVDYLMNHELKDYFHKDLPEEERARLKSSLEEIVNASMTKYDDELGGISRKVGTRGSMALNIANQLYGYVSKVPVSNVIGLSNALYAGKTIWEIPAMYRYLKKSKDWYGALGHYAMKPLIWLLPVLGPAIESGSFERMVMRGVLKDAKYNFIKKHGEYEAFEDRMQKTLKMPIQDISEYEPMKKAA